MAVLRKMRIDFESLQAIKPDTIPARISTFGPARVPAGTILGLDAVPDDPQVKARELLRHVTYPGKSQAVPPRRDAGAAVRDARRNPSPRVDAGRTHRRDPR